MRDSLTPMSPTFLGNANPTFAEYSFWVIYELRIFWHDGPTWSARRIKWGLLNFLYTFLSWRNMPSTSAKQRSSLPSSGSTAGWRSGISLHLVRRRSDILRIDFRRCGRHIPPREKG